ncbi:hypothetical protein CRM22_000160 [Opisthorchis felineus]|uniref:Dual serine/threonine and tyrosine protein kinase n=1 Tax=Opisthorchis felineus TaxID=147828 RepID=A0A4S2MGA5_OPIFE|nr:hypothetical protein CRM22_000160 [Opisthorchis felineus]
MLTKDIRRFRRCRAIIRKNLRDLRRAFRLIEQDEFNGHFLRAAGVPFQMTPETERLCTQIAEKPVAFVILGQNNYSKALLVNELLQKQVLPVEKGDTQTYWCLISIHGGSKHATAVMKQANPLGKDLNDSGRADLEKDCDLRTAYLDITLPEDPLLVGDLRIIVSASQLVNSVNELCNVFERASSGVLPIYIYAMESKLLTSWDLIELSELRRLAEGQPILFVVVPTRNSYGAQTITTWCTSTAGPHRTKQKDLIQQSNQLSVGRQSEGFTRNHLDQTRQLNQVKKYTADRIADSKSGEDKATFPGESININYVEQILADHSGELIRLVHQRGHQSDHSDMQNSESQLMENRNDSGPTQDQPNFPFILTQLGFLARPSGTEVGEPEGRRPASPDSGNSSLTGSFAKQTDGALLQEIPSANSYRCSLLNEVSRRLENEQSSMNSELVYHFEREFHTQLSAFVRQRLRQQVFWALGSIEAAALECLKGFVLQAYDLAHDLLVTPRRLEFARTQEARLYEKLTQTAKQRQPEILNMIRDTLKEMRDIVPEMAARDLSFLPFGPPKLSNDIFTTGSPLCSQQWYKMIGPCPVVVMSQDATGRSGTSKLYSTSCCDSSMSPHSVQEQVTDFRPPAVSRQDYTKAVKVIRDYVLSKLTNVIAARLLDCLEVLRLSCIGTLERTIEKLENLSDKELYSRRVMSCPFLKHLTDDDTPEEFIHQATDNYCNQEKDGSEWSKHFRITPSNENLHCLWSFNSTIDEFRGLERSPEAGEHCVGSALRALLTFTYELTVPLKQTTNAQLSGMFDKLKSVFVAPLPWRTPAVLDATWTACTARSILNGLCENAIARKLSAQVTEKLRQSHEKFLTTLYRLEVRTEMRNCRFEDAQDNIIRQHAPRLARTVLETSALRHYLTHGLPSLGKELGRGQYGVVYACSSWGGHSLLAVKSVVPPDEKHWRDLAMELFYSRQLPQHDRIATVHAHVIDYDRAHGSEPAVLLIMERLARDLHIALKQGLSWLRRLIVARDVAEGVRYLHSQGLIHRDIKPRNVLLDLNDRAKLTDLGFCKPQAMISGSILGTPLHMAPEILQKKYDYTIDIYAWGILFWYICAGSVLMPRNFDKCTDKEVLWSAVRKGVRPERLKSFTDDCWDLMEQCWSRCPQKRPHSGQIVEAVDQIYEDEVNRSTKTRSVTTKS